MNQKNSKKTYRYIEANELRADDDRKEIAGYFAVFDDEYKVFDYLTESIAPGAFADSIKGDVRCCWNHDTGIVLGRTSASTLILTEDDHGLYGVCKINENDSDAVNAYERIKRGDVSQCSIGFQVVQESWEDRGESSHVTIEKANLLEVSPVTFPAYESTAIQARSDELKDHKEQRKAERFKQWKEGQLNELKKITQ